MDIRLLFRTVLSFIFFILLQIIVLDNVRLSSLGINPYIYILFIMLLPFETPKWLLLLLAFATGLTIDIFSDTPGIHSSATLFLAFLRPGVLNLLAPRDSYEPGTLPRISYMGFAWFIKYSIMLIFAHHFFYFFIDVFSFKEFHITLFKIIATSAFSLIIIILSQYFIFKK